MNRPNLDSLTKEQVAYIEYLEGGANGASDLIKELNLVSKAYANDLKQLRTGEGDNPLRFINKDKDSKIFERTMILFDKIEKIRVLSEYTSAPVEQAGKPKKNIQDWVINGKNG